MIEKLISESMPGDIIQISDSHIQIADRIYPLLNETYRSISNSKFVLAIYGGSGVGKSEIGHLIVERFIADDIPTHIISGDNYPLRVPSENDRERENRYRYAGLTALSRNADFSKEWMEVVEKLWQTGDDCDPRAVSKHPFLSEYQAAGRDALEEYLGNPDEIDFNLINKIIRQFKCGKPKIIQKKMGRMPNEIWFEKVDVLETKILIIEWTHGNSELLEGVDFPVFLYSTPDETLEHRRWRNRDDGVDSSFIRQVLEIEQKKLLCQIANAKLIISKSGELINYEQILEN